MSPLRRFRFLLRPAVRPGFQAAYAATIQIGESLEPRVLMDGAERTPFTVEGVGGSFQFVENDAALVLAPAATISGGGEFGGGLLRVRVPGPVRTAHRIAFGDDSRVSVSEAGDVTVDGATAGRVVIGGEGGRPFQIRLAYGVTPETVQTMLRAMTFASNDDRLREETRVLEVLVSNRLTSFISQDTTVAFVPVNDPPILSNRGGSVAFRAPAVPVVLYPSITVADVDSHNFSGGVAVFRTVEYGRAGDRVLPSFAGTFPAGNRVDIVGDRIHYNGQEAAIFHGGTSNAPLRIRFRGIADAKAVTDILRSVRFSTPEGGPLFPRRIELTLSDGDGGPNGGVSEPAGKSVYVNT